MVGVGPSPHSLLFYLEMGLLMASPVDMHGENSYRTAISSLLHALLSSLSGLYREQVRLPDINQAAEKDLILSLVNYMPSCLLCLVYTGNVTRYQPDR